MELKKKKKLPSLRRVHVSKSIEMNGPSWDSVQSFITSRSISGRPLELDAPYQCHICDHSPREPKFHLRDKHGYQMLCSYCGEFECTLGSNDLFREHLRRKHPEIAHNEALISEPCINPMPHRLDDLVHRHSSLHAPDVGPLVVPPSSA